MCSASVSQSEPLAVLVPSGAATDQRVNNLNDTLFKIETDICCIAILHITSVTW